MTHASTARVHAESACPVATGADAAAVWLDEHLDGRPVPGVLLAIGLGDGALLDVLDRRAPASRVVAVEPDPALAAVVMQQPAFARWLQAGRLTYLVGPDYAGSEQAWRALHGAAARPDVMVHPSVREHGGPASKSAAEVLRRIVFGARANEDARRRFAPRYLANTLRNVPALARGRDVNAIRGTYAGVPAILTAAGPSLDRNLDEIAAVSGRALVIAADTTLRPLVSAGIAPGFVVAADPGAANARHFAALPECARTWLIAESAVDPATLAPFEGRTLWFRVANHHPWPWLRSLGLDVGTLEMWGSVLTAAFQTAVLAGCDPIVFVGADLAYTDGRPYCRGTAYEFDWAAAVAAGVPLEGTWRTQAARHPLAKAKDLRGQEVLTSGALQSFRDWLAARADDCGRTIINATGDGILSGAHITQARLAAAIGGRDLIQPVSMEGPAILDDRAALAGAVRALGRALSSEDGSGSSPLAAWAAFLGDAYDTAAVATALEDAERALDASAVVPRTAHQPAPWSAFSNTRTLLSSVPEWTAQLRGVLTGEDDGEACDSVTASLRLRQAFELLTHVTEHARRFDDLPPTWNAYSLGHVPIGAAIAWPESLSWPVRLIEALIGSTLHHRFAPTGPVFETRPVALRDDSGDERGLVTAPESAADGICRMLALEWLLAAMQQASPREANQRAAAWIRAIQPTLLAEGGDHRVDARITISLRASDWHGRVSCPLSADERQLVRLLTGTLAMASSRPRRIHVMSLGSTEWSGVVELAFPAGSGEGADEPGGVLIRPRVLSDEGHPTAWLAYPASGGAMCAKTDGTGSVLVREDGSVVNGRGWPRPVTGAATLGATLEIAWGADTARWPDGGTGYVMWREAGDEHTAIEALPYAPGAATIANGRVYWSGFPFGWASWAPGHASALSDVGLSLYGVHPDAGGIVLHPRVRNEYGGTERRLSRHGVRIVADGTQAAVDLGPYGSVSTRADGPGWSAAAHPEADLISLTSETGASATLTVYMPYAVAWAGRSLVVTTASGDVLFFDHLADRLAESVEVRAV